MPPLEAVPLPVLTESACACRPERTLWRSLAEVRGEAPEPAEDEFPPGAALPPSGVDRRAFLQLLGASMALAGLDGCFQSPEERILPYNRQPPEITPGNALHYATTLTLDGIGTGAVVRSNEGRPTKIEGNPDHPANLGATSTLEQGMHLGLYDPDRASEFTVGSEAASARELFQSLVQLASSHDADRGASLRFLLEPSASPLRQEMVRRVLAQFPAARVYTHAPSSPTEIGQDTELAYGRRLSVVPAFAASEVTLVLDSDFLAARPADVRFANDFVRTRDPDHLGRLYVAESHLSVTGAFADHRLRLKPSEVLTLAQAIAREIGAGTGHGGLQGLGLRPAPLSSFATRWVKAASADLLRHRGRALVVAGARQPPVVQALAHACNEALGNVGRTLRLHPPIVDAGSGSLRELVQELQSGKVRTLVITAFNPLFTAPGDLDVKGAFEKVATRVYLGMHRDETGVASTHFAPKAHALESWGDARWLDGTTSLVQPLIAPLHGGITEEELLAPFAGFADARAHDLLKGFWGQKVTHGPLPDAQWQDWLVAGLMPGSASPETTPTFTWAALGRALASAGGQSATEPGLELELVTDAKVHDGRFANVTWLQELPDPITKLTWGNAVLVSPKTASSLGVGTGDVVTLQARAGSIEGPVLVAPGQADDTVTVALGYGTTSEAQRAARGVGFDAYRIRSADKPWAEPGVRLTPTGRGEMLAVTQHHDGMEGRDPAIQKLVDDFRHAPGQLDAERGPVETLYEPELSNSPEYQWAMSVDLNRCTGCSACMIACQAENNIPVVGKIQVERNRWMHWLRVDRYFQGSVEDPGVIHQPMMCQHCETAPCEYVCPVFATVHSDEGLNQMVYNRCVGTRYCSNNCPYKVRRFNFLDYHRHVPPTERMAMNPDVTVRARGVMEKCTYCVQRIERARISAHNQGRAIRDGEVVTACSQACPTDAIVFGSLTHKDAAVTRNHQDVRRYDVLHDRGTRPRTAYLIRLKNPNPELA